MSAVAERLPEVVDFPDPRNFPDPRKSVEQQKKREKISMPRPSIDSILSRMNSSGLSSSDELHYEDEGFSSNGELDQEEIRRQQRELVRMKAETTERIRVARELEILVSARESLLDNREALFSARLSGAAPDKEISTLENSLNETREALNTATQTLAEMEGVVSSLRSEIENIRNADESCELDPSSCQVNDYEDVTHKSLAEQVAFLREREAFIEESENVLFDKAQHLQEWQTRLEQKDHHHVNGQGSGNGNSHASKVS